MRILSIVVIASLSLAFSAARAGEVGRSKSRSSARASSSSGPSPAITDPNFESRLHVADTFKAGNTGLDSVTIAAGVSKEASRQELVAKAKRNAALTTRYANKNINVDHCKPLHRHVNASCYGLRDGFRGGPTLIGAFNPKLITAAYPEILQQGNILVVRNPHTQIARAVTITDFGPSDKMQKQPYNRAIDLSSSAFDLFGLRCDKDGVMKDIEIYQCPSS